jgi:hypothetical protein
MSSEPTRLIVEGRGRDSFRGRSRLERALLPFLREQTLWPVLVVLVAHVVAMVAPLLVLMLRDRKPWAAAGVAAFGLATAACIGMDIRGHRRPGSVSGLFAVVWLLCGAGAFAAARLGLF